MGTRSARVRKCQLAGWGNRRADSTTYKTIQAQVEKAATANVSSGLEEFDRNRLFVRDVDVHLQRVVILDQQTHHLFVVFQTINRRGENSLADAWIHHFAQR